MEAHLKDLFCRFHQHFGTGPGLGPSSGTCLLKINGISPLFVKSLYRALAALYRTDPWKRLRPGHLFGLRVGKDSDWSNKKQTFPCAQFIGGDGGDLGLHLFKSEQDALKVSLPVETKHEPNVEILRVIFEKESLLSTANKRMVASLALEPSGTDRYPIIDVARGTSSGGEIRFRDPTMEELRYLIAFIKAITLVHPLLQPETDNVTKNGRNVNFEPFIETVDVQWPSELATAVDLVAVTISYPPNQTYEEKKLASPIKYIEPPKEEEDFSGSRQCAMCEKPVQWDQSLCCGRCKAIIYCGPICQKNHWRETHKSMCGLYKAMMEREEELAMKIFKFNFVVDNSCQWLESMGLHKKGMWRRLCDCYAHHPFGLLPTKSIGAFELWGGLGDKDYPSDKPLANHIIGNRNPVFLSGWSEYYNIRSLPMSSPVAAILSHPLTVYHILTTLVINSKNRLIKGKEVIVHYLGPAVELDWLQAFDEISHLLNGLGNVQIFMIGPEVPSNLLGPVSGLGSRLRVNLVRGLYQEQYTNLPAPHMVIALNCGFESYGSWSGALGVIKSINVPVFFTERSEVLCTSAKQVLRTSGLHLTHPVGPNPFRSPLREQMHSTNLPSFSNGFIFGVNT
ncbi:Zinc finger MYND domain-containing protein 15 [Rhynchospora pubera]|uniref:Zinc finger MYND domain-containing protein 15 n=1 Tax=Rhynchospora pubera TaxID=906938 RepID=A0AAV8CZU7_9POAL|nr:Zinc finger MYND domain-containing protein 15 [Rhynchospora pubera]